MRHKKGDSTNALSEQLEKTCFLFLLAIFLFLIFPPRLAFCGPIEELQPGQWYQIPNTRIDQAGVFPSPMPPNNDGYDAIFNNWCGGTYDPLRERLIVHCGGHYGYAGNEIYVFSLITKTWSRAWGPTSNANIRPALGGSPSYETYLDGNPSARHTYDGLVFAPELNKLYVIGGCLWGPGEPSTATWEFDFNTLVWTQKANFGSIGATMTTLSAWDPSRKVIWFFTDNGNLVRFDPRLNTHTKVADHGTVIGQFDPARTMAYHPVLDRLYIIGGNEIIYINCASPTSITRLTGKSSGPSGESTCSNGSYCNGPGFDWDPVLQKLVGWNGGRNVYSLNTADHTWMLHSPTNSVTPSSPPRQGIYGRWAFVPSKNAWITVNAIDQNVFIYKLAADPISLTSRTWTRRNYAPWGSGYMETKHTRTFYDAKRRQLVTAGGDVPNGVFQGSYNGNMKVFSKRLSTGDTAWSATTVCPSGGTIVPKIPDTVSWVYDLRNDRGIMIPGFYFGTQNESPVCTGMTETNNPVLFNFANNLWADVPWPPPSEGYGGDVQGGSFSVYDPITHTVIRLSNRNGNHIGRLNLTTNAWTNINLTGSYNSDPNRDQPVIDVAGRKVYWINRSQGNLTIYNIDTNTFTASASIPPGTGWSAVAGDMETRLAFDTRNRVIMYPDTRWVWGAGDDGNVFRGRIRMVYFYHVDTNTWAYESPPSEPYGGYYVRTNDMAYDEDGNVFALLGGNQAGYVSGMWLYRYSGGASPSDTIAPAPVQNLTIQ